MKLICPECKNEVDLSPYSDIDVGHAVECQMCGISLKVSAIDEDKVRADIMDEGK
jgi:DNA-directed RNA polymerase subunit RPC12/RpoP